jgi:uncharacterized membrane protein
MAVVIIIIGIVMHVFVNHLLQPALLLLLAVSMDIIGIMHLVHANKINQLRTAVQPLLQVVVIIISGMLVAVVVKYSIQI